MPSLLTVLLFITAAMLLWYAVQGEAPNELIKRALGGKKNG